MKNKSTTNMIIFASTIEKAPRPRVVKIERDRLSRNFYICRTFAKGKETQNVCCGLKEGDKFSFK